MSVTDLAEYQRAWRAWWSELLLACQGSTGETNWESLCKRGKTGFLLIMVSLVWWGSAKVDDEWKKAVSDVTAALRCMQMSRSSTSSAAKTVPQKRKQILQGSGADEKRPARNSR